MKQNKGPLIFLTFFTIILFINNNQVHKAILEGCELFITKLFPSLFPMMILSDCFIYFGLPEFLCKYIGNAFSKLFHVSPYGAFAFFTSCFSGSPSNAYIIKNLYLKNYLTEEEAAKLLSFSFFSNPLFLFTMLSLIFPDNLYIILKLLLLPYVANFILGFLAKKEDIVINSTMKKRKENFGAMLSQSIKNAMNTELMILGSISIFFIINAIINPQNIPFISGLLEISQGLNRLIGLSVSTKLKEILAIIFISFGGLSIHLQIKGILSDTNISYLKFLKGRIYQTILSVILIFIF